jgi:cytochrome c-type biogenesis protein CcsB
MIFSPNIENLENFTMNSSFFCLLLSMVFYWIYTFFKGKTLVLGNIGMICANLSLFTLLVLRWKESGHFPLSNLYESLIFLSWAFTTIHLILENMTKISFLGSITSPSALLTNAFATFSLPSDMQHSAPLVPALQSNWLMMHVTVMIVSYAALICGSLLAIAFLIVFKTLPENAALYFDNSKNQENLIFSNALTDVSYLKYDSPNNFELSDQMRSFKKLKLAETLDHLSYRILGLGFPFLTIGILSGAVWANEAWGSYWSWDPKETWALLTWLVFAIYLHTRFSKGWSGERPALIASLGFIVVWVCYLGVNLIGEGLHSYGWIHS